MRATACTRLFAVAAAILLAPSESAGQGGGGASGQLGVSSLGQGGGRSSFGSGGLGSQGAGGAFGGSSFGSSFGQSNAGANRFGVSGSSGVGSGANGQPAFVGRSAADIQSFFGGQFDGSSGNRSRRSRSSRSEANPTGQRRPPVDVRLSVDPKLLEAAGLDAAGQRAIQNASRLFARKGLDGVAAMASGGSVRLEGDVASEAERLLAEKLIAIEPGVREIENLLKVLPKAADSLPAPR